MQSKKIIGPPSYDYIVNRGCQPQLYKKNNSRKIMTLGLELEQSLLCNKIKMSDLIATLEVE